ncbi:MAG: peptidoglycan-binding protein [Candidatus Nanopelagicales bacterium]|nr:peptidoglycan-binding protein [Candidatus Nanopelagicales bacterium]
MRGKLVALGIAAAMVAVPVTMPELSASAIDSIKDGLSQSTPTKRVVSGVLPGGGKFTIPAPPKPPYPVPGSPTGIRGGKPAPDRIESAPAYLPQTSCDPREKAGITAFKKLVLDQYPIGTDWGSVRNCTDDGISEHLEGRAWDWHVDVNNPKAFTAAANVLQWLTANSGANARRLGIMYIGYNHRIWGAYRPGDGWRVLNNSNPHTDHVHFSFTWNGATKRTSFWTGRVAAQDYGPCRPFSGQPAPRWTTPNTRGCNSPAALPSSLRGYKLLWQGSRGAAVTDVQAKVGVAPTTGFYGAATTTKVAAYQQARGLPVTGAVDARTAQSLAGNNAPAAIKPVAAKVPVRHTLRVGSKGAVVKRLQRALKMPKKYRTGRFGPITKKAVKRWQRKHHRRATGVVRPPLQRRLGI